MHDRIISFSHPPIYVRECRDKTLLLPCCKVHRTLYLWSKVYRVLYECSGKANIVDQA
jgi:hypothetical protein